MSTLGSCFGSKAPDVGPPAIEQSVLVSLSSMAEVEAAMPLATDINVRFFEFHFNTTFILQFSISDSN